MKKGGTILVIVIVILVLAGGGYALWHKSKKNNSTTNSNKNTASSTSNTAAAVNNSVLVTKTSSSLGQYLADPSGNALYTYGGDTQGVSNCTGSCLASWPAYVDKGSTSNLPAGVSTIKRSDNGENQYTYLGMPLYYFASDTNGSVTGNNVSNFKVAKPSSSDTSSQSSSSPNNPY